MFKRGGFASYTRTGRRMQFGAAVGATMARGSNSSTRSSSNSEEPTAFAKFMLVLTCLYILHTITQILKQK